MQTKSYSNLGLVTTSLAAALIFVFFIASAAGAAVLLEELKMNPKILKPDVALAPYVEGQDTASVIVMLEQPPAVKKALEQSETDAPTSALNSEESKTRRRQTVVSHTEQVLSELALPAQAVTTRFQYMSGFAATVSAQELLAIAGHPLVRSIEENAALYPKLAQGIPLMAASAPRAQYKGQGTAVAICDSGVDYNHPMLGGGAIPNGKIIGGYDTGDDDTDPMDSDGHGTACAGIAAGSIPGTISSDYIGGVAPEAKIYALKIVDSQGDSSMEYMIQAWEWAITHQNDDPNNPILVIHTSFGGSQNFSPCDGNALATAAANANAAGMAVFAPAGNDGWCNAIEAPACVSDVISVGAVYDAYHGEQTPCVGASSCVTKYPAQECDEGYYTIDDSETDKVCAFSSTASFLDMLAPADYAYTTGLGGSYDPEFSGTSAATPYAAGAALVLQQAAKAKLGRWLTPDEVRTYLTTHGDLIADEKVDITKPRVNLQRAVNALPRGDGDITAPRNLLLLHN